MIDMTKEQFEEKLKEALDGLIADPNTVWDVSYDTVNATVDKLDLTIPFNRGLIFGLTKRRHHITGTYYIIETIDSWTHLRDSRCRLDPVITLGLSESFHYYVGKIANDFHNKIEAQKHQNSMSIFMCDHFGDVR